MSFSLKHHLLEVYCLRPPCSSVVKNPPAANVRDMGLIPGPGESHMPWSNEACVPQLSSLCSRVRELQLLKPRHLRACALQSAKPLQ